MTIKANTIKDIQLLELPMLGEENGSLVVMEALDDVPIEIQRVFVVKGFTGAVRGQHAHRELTQVLTCVHGTCEVICDDSHHKKTVKLVSSNQALCIPPGIWAEQLYEAEDSVLVVLCDKHFDEQEYIRDYSDFLKYRQQLEK